MAQRKTERMLNLMIALLTWRRFVTKQQIRSSVEGYNQDSDAAFERQFERDKDELRALGIPIETGHNDPLFEDELGYRIKRQDFELPEITFDPAELAVLGVAARAWQNNLASSSTQSALTKLRAAGIEPDTHRLSALAPQVNADEPAFDPLWQAATSRQRVRFGYRDQVRNVDPWQLLQRRGAWYLIGYDHDKGEPRTFKLSRIADSPVAVGESNAYVPATAERLAELAAKLEPARPTEVALLAIAPGAASELRRRGEPVSDVTAPIEGFTVFAVPYARQGELVDEVCAAGATAVVLEPAVVRTAVIAQLTALAGGAP